MNDPRRLVPRIAPVLLGALLLAAAPGAPDAATPAPDAGTPAADAGTAADRRERLRALERANGDMLAALMESELNNASSQWIAYAGTVEVAGTAAKSLTLQVHAKRGQQRLEFLSPADIQGSRFLLLSPSEAYVYLPTFGRVRRLSGPVLAHGLFGMPFAPADFRTRFRDDYEAAVPLDDPRPTRTLVLTAKPDAGPAYARIELTFDTGRAVPSTLKYFDAAGVHLKTETRSGYTCAQTVCAPAELTMVDETAPGTRSRLTRTGWKVNEPVADELFSKKTLDK